MDRIQIKTIIMAAIQLVTIPAVPASGTTTFTSPCEDIQLNVQNIQDVRVSNGPGTLPQYGIQSVLNVKYVKANHFETATIYSTLTPTQIKALTNA